MEDDVSKWQSIESAPKDGRLVRLHNEHAGNFYDCDGRYVGSGWELPHFFVYDLNGRAVMSPRPTHWRPLNDSHPHANVVGE